MQALGITQTGNQLRIALLGKSKKGYEIHHISSFDVKQLDTLFDLLKNDRVKSVTAIGAKNLLFRKKSFSLSSKRKLDSVLPFEIETLLPYPVEEAAVSLIQKKIDKKTTDVAILAVKKNYLDEHLATWSHLGIDPHIVSSVPSALFKITTLLFKEHTCILTIHIGAVDVSVIAVLEGELISSHSIPFDSPENCAKQIERFILFIRQKMKIPSDIEIFLCSDSQPLQEIKPFFKSHFKSYSFLESEELFNVPFELIETYAINLGLAIDALGTPDQICQFRSIKTLSSSFATTWKKRIQLYTIIGSSLLLTIFVSGEVLIRKKENALFTPYTKHFQIESQSGGYQKEELIRELIQLEKKIQKQKKSFEYLPSIPTVSELIAYLTTLDQNQINICHLRYLLEKYPKLEHESVPYLVKIELDFQAPSLQAAKHFFESVKSNRQFVDPQKKMTFSPENSLYKTTFYLKGE